MAKAWQVKARMATGKATERVENGIRIYNPGKIEWVVIKEFDSPAKADDWLCSYIKKNGYRIDDFNIVRS